jgi:ribosomal protein L19
MEEKYRENMPTIQVFELVSENEAVNIGDEIKVLVPIKLIKGHKYRIFATDGSIIHSQDYTPIKKAELFSGLVISKRSVTCL